MRHGTQTSRDAPCTINPTATPTCSSTPGRGRAYDRLWHEVKYGPVLNLSAYWSRPEVIVFFTGWRGASAHSRFSPVPGAFSNTQRVGGLPQTLSSSLKPTQCPSGLR